MTFFNKSSYLKLVCQIAKNRSTGFRMNCKFWIDQFWLGLGIFKIFLKFLKLFRFFFCVRGEKEMGWLTPNLRIGLTFSARVLASRASCSQTRARSRAPSLSTFIACIFFLMASMSVLFCYSAALERNCNWNGDGDTDWDRVVVKCSQYSN